MPVIFWSSWDEVLAVQYFIWTLTKSTLIQKDLQLPIPLAAELKHLESGFCRQVIWIQDFSRIASRSEHI